MYNTYFSFSDSPFENNLDQRFLFLSEDHSEVLASLLYFVRENKPFALLCGDVGTGKTMIINCFLDRLSQSIHPIIISNPTVDCHEILFCVARKLSISIAGRGVLEVIDEVKEALIKAAAEQRQYILIIDEAHLLSDQSLEHIRLLSNIETSERKLLQILLTGQYELSHKLNRPEMRQLRQRISINRFLSTLDASETIQYIDHRLKVAGSRFDACFEPDTRKLIYKLTKGFPRLINQICDNALLVCKAEGLEKVNKQVLKRADEALRSDLIFTPKPFKTTCQRINGFTRSGLKSKYLISNAVFLLLIGSVFYAFYFIKNITKTVPDNFPEVVQLSDVLLNKTVVIKDNETQTVIKQNPVMSGDLFQNKFQKDPAVAQAVSQMQYPEVSLVRLNDILRNIESVAYIEPAEKNEKPSTSAENIAGISDLSNTEFPAEKSVKASLAQHNVVVQGGDTLTGIAYRHYAKKIDLGMEAILSANPDITDKDLIYPEQVLTMPEIDTEYSVITEPVYNGETFFTVQVSTLSKSDISIAKELESELKKKGFPAYIAEEELLDGRYLFRICIGRYVTEKEAEKVALSFAEKENKTYIIVKSDKKQ